MSRRRARSLICTLSTLSIALAFSQESPRKLDTIAIPLDLEVNGQSVGDITIEADPLMQAIALDVAGLKSRVATQAPNALTGPIDALTEGFVPIEELQGQGIDISLDPERLVIALKIEEKKPELKSNRQYIPIGNQQNILRSNRHTNEAKLSGFANFDARVTRSKNEVGSVSETQSVNIDHALNIGGFAIEGDSSWSSRRQGDGNRFKINRLRLVKDYQNSLLRLSLGDISTPIKDPQRGFQLWGVSLGKDFDIQPYRVFTPTSSASFQLEENATVQMRMNGRPQRNLKLEPGIYDIEQFKLAAGLNTMELEIVTETGAVERIAISNYGEPTLLNKGTSAYAFSFGLPQSFEPGESFLLVDSPWYQRSLSLSPVASGYYQKGIGDNITANVNLQFDDQWIRLGGQATWVNELGVFSANAGLNQVAGLEQASLKTRVDWRRDLLGYKLLFTATQSSRDYDTFRSDFATTSAALKGSYSARVAKRFGERFSFDVGYLQRDTHDGNSDRSANLNFGYRFPSFHVGLNLKRFDTRSAKGVSGFLTLTWNPRDNWRTRTRLGRESNGVGSLVSTNVDYSVRKPTKAISANLNLQSGSQGREFDGRARFEAGNYSATLSRAHLYRNIDGLESKGVETTLNGEFAIAYADGAFGITRRISDSFAIITNHKAWSDVTLGINPTLGGFEQRASKGMLKPVLANLRPYRESLAIVHPLGGDTFLENEDFYFLPSYKRGSKLTIGNEFVYTVRSTLLYWNEQPAGYKTLKITGEGIPEILTFTNNSGKFIATGLKPGVYEIKVNGANETAQFEINGDQKLVFIESIKLADPNSI